MFCSNCGTGVLDNQRFCGRCGASVEVPTTTSNPTCSRCGSELESGANFCDHCGEPTTNVARSPRPIPRNVTSGPVYRDTGDQPSYAPTILVSLFFGAFGLIPAFRHSSMARERGYSGNGYWWAFGLTIAFSWGLGIILVIVETAIINHSINSGTMLPVHLILALV